MLWKLTPIDRLDPNWETSAHRGGVIVRARTEGDAREVAAKAFGLATRFPPSHGLRTPPWTRSTLVRAEPVRDERFPTEGDDEVLQTLP